MHRRQFLKVAGAAAFVSAGYSRYALAAPAPTTYSARYAQELRGHVFDLTVAAHSVNYSGKNAKATLVNGSLPAPILRMQEGDTVTIRVTNTLDEDTSIHWHGLLLPYTMDGVPGVSFSGIPPGQTFTYQFPLLQSGTYWYHAHSGFQEQTGLLGAIIIDPKHGDGIHADREHVIVLSDWTDKNPHTLLRKLKMQSGFDNYNQPTVAQFLQDARQIGWASAWSKRAMWNAMRMMPTDFADLSAVHTYTYLMNGANSAMNWTGLFNKGETLRLRIINASAHTIFDVRIPGLRLNVIGADGGLVEPVSVDELRIGAAETYDVLVTPQDDAYTVFAQSIDRSGFCRGTLATRVGLTAPVPAVDPVEWLNMTDMMGSMEPPRVQHTRNELGHTVDYRVDYARNNLDDSGVNLRHGRRKVLTYADLHSIGHAKHEQRDPTRNIELHLTGNMERYIWGMDGLSYHQAKPLRMHTNERVRITLVNDTMMTHPMHLHGMWSDLRDEVGDFQVRKHTVMVQPAQKIAFDVTAEAGRWLFHCHLLYHMQAGMMRDVWVEDAPTS